MRKYLLLLMLCCFMGSVSVSAQEQLLHVPSPVWEDQIIYFIMTDRFNDGDPTNNNQAEVEFAQGDDRKYQGGDFQGILDELDYIQGLGATTLWITPPVANNWWGEEIEYGGYHGYWARDFMAVDEHLGTLEDYKQLSHTLHGRQMFLIQDIVTNHVGDYFTYWDTEEEVHNWNENDPTQGYRANTNHPTPLPVPPFDQNDPRNPAHLEAAIYHFTPDITNYNDPNQRLNYQLSGLDDLNTANPIVREALREAYGYWIEEVGVDGFRIDTAIYVEHEFWQDFIHNETSEFAGVNVVAQSTGRENFLTFGEAWVGSGAFNMNGEQVIPTYLGTTDQPEMASMLNFPVQSEITRVFAEGHKTSAMTYRLEGVQRKYPNPNILPIFLDNHDMPRFLNKSSQEGLKQALVFLMSAQGIPVIYYGTEQGFTDTRATMFAEGVNSDGIDHFDPSSELYQHIANLSALRKANPTLSRGGLTVLGDSTQGAGLFAFKRDYEGESLYAVFNTADTPILADFMTDLPQGTTLNALLNTGGTTQLTVGAEGRILASLPARESLILEISSATSTTDALPPAEITLTTDLSVGEITESITLQGHVSVPDAELMLVINGTVADDLTFTAGADGRWETTLPIDRFKVGKHTSLLQVYAPQLSATSDAVEMVTRVQINGDSIRVSDPADDDNGIYGIYGYPTDSTFSNQLDVLSAEMIPSGSNLLLRFEMAEVTTVWNPTHGFDHVLFHIFIDVPEQTGGASVLPYLNAEFAEDFSWDYMTFIDGWNTRLHSSDGASAETFGSVSRPAPEISVKGNTIEIVISGEALGRPTSLQGARVYVALWDWEGVGGSHRPLTADGGQWAFSSGTDEVLPRIMEDLWINWEPSNGHPLKVDLARLP